MILRTLLSLSDDFIRSLCFPRKGSSFCDRHGRIYLPTYLVVLHLDSPVSDYIGPRETDRKKVLKPHPFSRLCDV